MDIKVKYNNIHMLYTCIKVINIYEPVTKRQQKETFN